MADNQPDNNVLVSPNLDDGDMQQSNPMFAPKLSRNIMRTVAYLIGIEKSTGKTKFVSVDENGNIVVDLSGSPSTNFVPANITITNTASLIVSSNSDRDFIRINNTSGNTLYIGGDNSVTTANGYQIQSGGSEVFNNYQGALYGIIASGSINIQSLELY